MITIILVALAALAVGLGVGFLGGRRRATRPQVDLVEHLRDRYRKDRSPELRAALRLARTLSPRRKHANADQ